MSADYFIVNMNKITKEEFFKNDYCIHLNDDMLTDDLEEYIDEIAANIPEFTCEEDIINLIESNAQVKVYKKKCFRLPKGFLKEHITEYMYDSWYCEDPQCFITDYDSIDKFEEEFNNKQHGWYVQAEEVGYMDLSLDVQEMLNESRV